MFFGIAILPVLFRDDLYPARVIPKSPRAVDLVAVGGKLPILAGEESDNQEIGLVARHVVEGASALRNRIDHGVWGGASERERRRIARQRRLSAAASVTKDR